MKANQSLDSRNLISVNDMDMKLYNTEQSRRNNGEKHVVFADNGEREGSVGYKTHHQGYNV